MFHMKKILKSSANKFTRKRKMSLKIKAESKEKLEKEETVSFPMLWHTERQESTCSAEQSPSRTWAQTPEYSRGNGVLQRNGSSTGETMAPQ